MLSEERKLVPVPALKDDLAACDAKKTATAKAKRVAPFEDRPLAVFKQVFNDANHF